MWTTWWLYMSGNMIANHTVLHNIDAPTIYAIVTDIHAIAGRAGATMMAVLERVVIDMEAGTSRPLNRVYLAVRDLEAHYRVITDPDMTNTIKILLML